MRRHYERQVEGVELGWISMTDLMMLFFAVGVLLAGMFATRAASSDAQRSALSQQIGVAQEALEKSRGELESWQIRSKDLEDRLGRYDELFEELGVSGQEADAVVTALREEVTQARASALQWQEEVHKGQRRLDSLGDELKALSARIQTGEAELTEARRQRREIESLLEKHGGLDSLVASVKDLAEGNRALEARAATSELESAELARGMEELRGELSDVSKDNEGLRREALAQRQIRQELLGLPGKLARVVMVVDRSQSMSEGSRWEDAKRTVTSWIEHLPVEAAVLVVFGADVAVVPSRFEPTPSSARNSVEIPVVDPGLRAEMVEALREIGPAGLTPTARALRQAMKFRDVDAIVLFTDGAPETGTVSGTDAKTEVFNLVDQWCAENPQGCIHTVGIGNYFDRQMRDFLLGVAKRGRGAFIGR